MQANWSEQYENLKAALKGARGTIEILRPELERIQHAEAFGVKGDEESRKQLKKNMEDAIRRVTKLEAAIDDFFS
ncbi:MAG: hypothetical protein Q7T44_05315 [Parvibaculum sp.]|nr:hypothetical protein [Parvibaculum sp.]